MKKKTLPVVYFHPRQKIIFLGFVVQMAHIHENCQHHITWLCGKGITIIFFETSGQNFESYHNRLKHINQYYIYKIWFKLKVFKAKLLLKLKLEI